VSLAALAGWLSLSIIVGALGGLATASSVSTWYPTLAKPSFNPPNAVFGPVWTSLYLLMALAAWRVWRKVGFGPQGRTALALYLVQMILNLAWSIIFFGLRAPGVALIEVALLFALVAGTAALFWRVDRAAGLMIVPYVAWVGFASLLNFQIWRLN
jgi:translocator protein